MHSCNRCKELINQIVRPKDYFVSKGREFVNLKAVNVGWLDSILENRNECTLYSLVARIWDTVQVTDGTIPEDDTASTSLTKGVYVCFDNATPTTIAKNSVRLHWLISLEFFYPGRGGSPALPVAVKWEPKFALLADDSSKLDLPPGEQPYLLGRLRSCDLPYDKDFVRDCFETCRTKHGQACSHPVRGNNGRIFPLDDAEELPLKMRCIDVIDRRVTHIPRDGSCHYAVLSYCWGASNFLLLTKANSTQLTAQRGLDRVRIPRTIANAMEITIAVGMRYLWVDALCIVQDDPSEKNSQIQKMHKIYASAALTIIAASGNGADDGLWDTTNGTRQPQIEEEIDGLRFVGLEPTLEDVLAGSIWKRRAWTYQEYVLSKRMLVFSKTEAYYSCEQGACAEDFVHSVNATGEHELNSPASDEGFAVSVDRLLNFPEYWPTLIREYTKREMSFQSDGLNAAAGVLASYSVGSKNSFICGLPLEGLFEYSLLWFASGPLHMRASCATGKDFPTWSWVGWVGPVSYEETDDIQDFDAGRIIHRWSLTAAQKTLSYVEGKLSISYASTAKDTDGSRSTTHVLRSKVDVDRHLTKIQSGVLTFQAQVVRLRMDSLSTNQLVMSDDTDCGFTGLYKIFQDTEWVGSVHMEHRIAQQLLQDTAGLHEFVALSISNTGPWYVSERTDLSDDEMTGEGIPLYGGADSNDEDPYNVMLVTYDTDGMIATRAGIGQIRKDKFDQANPVLKDIKLH